MPEKMIAIKQIVERQYFLSWFLANLTLGQEYIISYKRVTAKCEHCNKTNSIWNELEFCPDCGRKLSHDKTAMCTFTYDTTITSHHNPCLQHFEQDCGNRNCRITNITKIIYNDVEYFLF